VVGTGVVQAADTVNADMEATEAPAEVTATPADVAAVATPAPRKPATEKDTTPASE
jgi:heparin binding hemagglutinin HbhA